MSVRKGNVRSEAQACGCSLFPKEEISTYWETPAGKGKGLFLRQGSTAQGTANNTKAVAGSHGTQAGSAAHSGASLRCLSHAGRLCSSAGPLHVPLDTSSPSS